jgi:hypothetical protein
MLLLKQFKPGWFIMSEGFPDGHWLAYTDEDVARLVLQWMVIEKFDCEGILRRLYAGTLTDDDRVTVKWIHYAAKHPTQYHSRQQNVYQRLARARAAMPEGEF